MKASLAYRKNEAAILRGDVPQKYLRLLPFISGRRVIEVGSAEGVLALLLAKAGKTVTALELRKERHDAALRLCSTWNVPESMAPKFVNGAIGDNLHLLPGNDTFVAVRMIYYLGDAIDDVFAEVGKSCPNVVLCGNRNRAARWLDCIPDDPGGPQNYYASLDGMRALLLRHGYTVGREETEGDPIVVGTKDA